MKTALAVRHVHFEDLGTLPAVLEACGYAIDYLDAPTASFRDFCERERDPELVVLLGGPISVNDTALYPFLEPELRMVRQRVVQDRPTLGICLGAQLIARALGARVYGMQQKEVGWSELEFTASGASHALRHLAATDVLHFHGETFDLPAGAELLASTGMCQNQAFAHGRSLGLQFHPEVDAKQLESWWVGHVAELGQLGVSIPELREVSRARAPRLEEPLARFIRDWLALVE